MPDPSPIADALPGASSTPADPSPVAAPSSGVDLDTLSPTELQTWRMDGTLPGTSPVTDAPAASSPAPAVQDPPASTDAPAQAASEPADSTNPKTKARIDELLAERSRERARADRAEAHIRAQEARVHQPAPDARPAASSPAPAGLVKPNEADFAYGTADPGYLEALTDYKVAVAQATQRTEWEQGQRAERARTETTRVITAFEQKAEAVRAKYADFDAVALLAPTEIAPGSAMDLYILEAPAGADILYHLQSPANTAERRRILKLGPLDQLTELVRLGDRLTSASPPARSTSAPPPPPTLSTRATPGDPVERAWALGDSDEATGAIIAAENARDLARMKNR
jgi:hypothetical protein